MECGYTNGNMAARYLILGASGFLGARLFASLGPENAVATYRQHAIPGGIEFDATKTRLAETLLRGPHCFTHAFILHGVTNIDACARDPVGTGRINVDSIKAVIDDLVEADIVPVFASSDAVFDGSRGMWTEADTPRPILTYGAQKLEIERYLGEVHRTALIVRMSKVVSIGAPNDMLGTWITELQRDIGILCAADQVFSPVELDDAVRCLVALAAEEQTGCFHLCGPAPVSRLDLLERLASEVRRYRPLRASIIPCKLGDLKLAEKRPLDTSMSPLKLYCALRTRCLDMDEVCLRAASRLDPAGTAIERVRG
jgi:dTDP-4-dehydrorhamnose reductase